MEQNKKEWKETLQYTIDENGKYIGSLVNYPTCYTYGNTLKQLVAGCKELMTLERDTMGILLGKEEPFDLQEMTEEEYNGREDNIDYWEIDRIQRLLKRSTMKTWLMNTITPIIANGKLEDMYSDDIANNVIEAIINYEQ